jgi:hypothetical protein
MRQLNYNECSHVACHSTARTLLLVIVASLVGSVIAVRAQESQPSSASLKRIRAALQSPQHRMSSKDPGNLNQVCDSFFTHDSEDQRDDGQGARRQP